MSGDSARSPTPAAVPDERTTETQLPWGLTALLVGSIVLAASLALVRPAFLVTDSPSPTPSGPTSVGIITGDRSEPSAAGRINALAPDFGWVTPQGPSTRLSALRERPVVLNFWATWCVPCRAEMPALERAAVAHPEIAFLEIDLQEDSAAVRSFFDRLELKTLIPLLDTDGTMFRRYGVVSLPTTFFIDRDGVIKHLEIGGPLKEETLRADLAKITPP